ncbi:hypothetical protein HanRHA438_Chr09g0418991 [Helianthus annuus]|uniref:Reverse transcriptase zinc-binding domain-containing protein n=1 Tax=Helianthus annuus TaxID=4232 RepID=A0A9K3I9S2_HELAN|nr:hypothetical protein HanXRQr2_Chr09g0406971 [Helianthus annuus]KAJ0527453.1 hypothetical protein HanHA300_Chr09g0334141 [Helianthus annuus]KAJ0536183.1 hypothetical protein HanIR_Chr09g0438741 [Helianthus annuus]KAJ0543862.1 hypothetical protein HanHA89_Chr09g0355211 [Helianthus annuus]KAJ0708915.1 hypothetical protein HanLR1_Chr09g0334511 [Helianthus annuus]
MQNFGERDEDADHLFISCYVTAVIWHKVNVWCSIPQIYAFTMNDLFDVHKNLAISNHTKRVIQMIILVACWVIWKARNDLIFSGSRPKIDKIFRELQAMSFL